MSDVNAASGLFDGSGDGRCVGRGIFQHGIITHGIRMISIPFCLTSVDSICCGLVVQLVVSLSKCCGFIFVYFCCTTGRHTNATVSSHTVGSMRRGPAPWDLSKKLRKLPEVLSPQGKSLCCRFAVQVEVMPQIEAVDL